jgi:hypothetical protein
MIFKRKLAWWISYIFYLLVAIIITDFLFYRCHKLKSLPKNLTEHNTGMSKLDSLVGWSQEDKKSCFSKFEKKKRDGVIRIGCFGDSFTHGDEVNDIYDYPSFLQGFFYKNGQYNVEVINFGVGGYGFHQSYILWEYAGREYDLDFVLLGPTCFRQERDTTFSTRFSYRDDIYLLHSRYILKNSQEVRRVDVIGKTIYQRVLNYWNFFPALRYLRFDRYPPHFLAAPLACLLPGTQLKGNPFYYKRDQVKEMDTIYTILLHKISEGTLQVILGTYDQHSLGLGAKIGNSNFFSVPLYRPDHFPYLAFSGHNSSYGNRVLAGQMYDCLINKTESNPTLVETSDIDRKLMRNVPIEKIKLSAYKDITLTINSVLIGRFYDITVSPWTRYCQGSACTSSVDTFSNTASLLFFKRCGASILDTEFLPLGFEIADDTPMTMRIHTKNKTKEYLVGRVQLLNPKLNIGILDSWYWRDDAVCIKKDNILRKGMEIFHPGDAVTILINGKQIMSGIIKDDNDDEIQFKPIKIRLFVIRADGRKTFDIEGLDKQGMVYLSLDRQGNVIQIPFAKWYKVNKQVSLGRPRLRFVPGHALKNRGL